jgi:hypothetical protein
MNKPKLSQSLRKTLQDCSNAAMPAASFGLRNRHRIEFRFFRASERKQMSPVVDDSNARWKTKALRLIQLHAKLS